MRSPASSTHDLPLPVSDTGVTWSPRAHLPRDGVRTSHAPMSRIHGLRAACLCLHAGKVPACMLPTASVCPVPAEPSGRRFGAMLSPRHTHAKCQRGSEVHCDASFFFQPTEADVACHWGTATCVLGCTKCIFWPSTKASPFSSSAPASGEGLQVHAPSLQSQSQTV